MILFELGKSVLSYFFIPISYTLGSVFSDYYLSSLTERWGSLFINLYFFRFRGVKFYLEQNWAIW